MTTVAAPSVARVHAGYENLARLFDGKNGELTVNVDGQKFMLEKNGDQIGVYERGTVQRGMFSVQKDTLHPISPSGRNADLAADAIVAMIDPSKVQIMGRKFILIDNPIVEGVQHLRSTDLDQVERGRIGAEIGKIRSPHYSDAVVDLNPTKQQLTVKGLGVTTQRGLFQVSQDAATVDLRSGRVLLDPSGQLTIALDRKLLEHFEALSKPAGVHGSMPGRPKVVDV